MSLTLHGIPNCDTVKKARKWLDDQGIAHDFRDYKKAPPTPAELTDWSERAGWEVLLNRAGTTFRKLPEDARTGIDEAKAIALMVEHPSMIKRPVVTGASALLVGFKPDQWQAVLKA
ncbi:Spx/MgsR family transcriptional regulator [Sphingobium sp. B11D3B]|uniref:arsenate reductase n=1 Tax=Sphingobium sp. B11D3B TaxID=2940575 RepID=UPI002226817D|nr:arsenate reductase [Sphingobium sp. B11D3B]MCW2389155.1 Spx/MgsR family transcriptional regulator [Sphingobium sp. B11D3B]